MSENLWVGIGSGEFKNNFILASHTLIGQFAELGVIGLTIIVFPILYYTFNSKMKKVYNLTGVVFVGGVFGLFPIAYIGWLYVLIECYVREKSTRLGI